MATQSSSSSSGAHKDAAAPQGGLRTHLRNMLPIPKRATFHVRLTVHQLSSLPRVSGQFAVKWKFRNVDSDALNKRIKAGKKASKDDAQPTSPGLANTYFPGEMHADAKGKGKETAPSEAQHSTAATTLVNAPGNSSSEAALGDQFKDVNFSSESRHWTPYTPLRDYNVVWEHTVHTAIDMHIDRESGDLLSNQLKLAVVERKEHVSDPHGKQNETIGHVVFNLAEYADAGPVTRKHLLRGNKTNATLKVTLHVEYMSGEKHYRPPPLRKSEIMAGISGLLTTMLSEFEDIHNRQPGSAPVGFPGEGLIPYSEDWSFNPIRPPLHRSRNSGASSNPGDARPRAGSLLGTTTISVADTTRLIETIFNPFPSSSPNPSPYTYYAPDHVPSSRPKTAQSKSGKDLLTVPGAGVQHIGLQLGATGTQERISAAAGEPVPVRPPTPSRSLTSTTASTSRSQHPSGVNSRKQSLDLDSSARSVAFSVASASGSGEGSVESHGDSTPTSRTRSHSSGTAAKPGWLKRLLSPHASSQTSTADSSSAGSRAKSPGRPRTPEPQLSRNRSRPSTPEKVPNGRGYTPAPDTPGRNSSSGSLHGLGFGELRKRAPDADATIRAPKSRRSDEAAAFQ